MNGAAGKGRTGTAKERSVFVGNIPYDVTEETLKNIFSAVGPVVNFRLVTDRDTGKPKGYGFCEYGDGATALSAMRNLNGTEVNGRNLRVDFADGGETQKSDRGDRTAGVSGEALIKSIESAVASQSRIALYDMLTAFQAFARSSPDATKNLLGANPVLVHGLIECFKKLNISMTALPPMLKTPAPQQYSSSNSLQRGGPSRQGGVLPPPPSGGILGYAPPPMQQHMPPPISGHNNMMMAPSSSPLNATAPPPMSRVVSRDPRAQRRDPRLAAKREPGPNAMDPKRFKHEPVDSAAADMARGMTADKLALLPPNERQMLIAFMQQNNIPYSS
ncbi:hypothetical protein H310_01730 [Aphanomyces invadans]|uniref:RRM domain-containing protein n=1 Tax=Aphanomyces invadans TaxID=157072 RepID=A0A024UUQ0_9STRA|nr:hypothetical protein H310_01730 [Aphanomyces invadans]ETW09368.1 hypothetical protein H310_01730 [Aphanomyces invadans]|eukprot:XP_008863173.1 hypothetical protein H310_01730 [Aphanomyces invadans]